MPWNGSDDFEIQGSLARCRICPNDGTTWMKLSNAKRHALSSSHRLGKQNEVQAKVDRKHSEVVQHDGDREDPLCTGVENQSGIDMDMTCDIFRLQDEVIRNYSTSLETVDLINASLFPMNDELPLQIEHDWTQDSSYFQLFDFEGNEDRESFYPEPAYTAGPTDSMSSWAPYPTKGMCLTDFLFSSPRLRFSEIQKRAVLAWGKALGAAEVPTLYALEKVQKELTANIGNPTVQKKSRKGNIFYVNDVGGAIGKDFSNPRVRPYLHFYPDVTENGPISQLWHGDKWRNQLSDDLLPPMAIHPQFGTHFYREELCQCKDGTLFIPQKWFTVRENEVWAKGYRAVKNQEGKVSVIESATQYPLNMLRYTYEELKGLQNIEFSADFMTYATRMPNPICKKAKKMPFYHVFVIIFIDDVSGNVSKQWNKHYVCYISNANLPREHLDKEFNVRFAASSPHVSALELAQGIKESFDTKEGIIGYDSLRHEQCMFRVIPFLDAMDNPMAAEICSQSGLASNFMCRTCNVGGTKESKRTNEGYLRLFLTGDLRSPAETRDSIWRQFMRALQPNSKTALESMIRESGVKDTVAQPLIELLASLSNELYSANNLQSVEEIQNVLNDKFRELRQSGSIWNPFLDMKEMNIHLDTPTETLHTILLGVVKYFWGQTVYLVMKDKKFDVFQARLESVSSDGLNIPQIMASYLCQYRGALIGKHFKSIVQILPFIIHDLVHSDLLKTWLLLGRLTVLCWHTEIKDMDSYTAELDSTIDQFLTYAAKCSPSILITKPKFHFLKHLTLYIRRFGPALLFATERYESFNSVFRQTCIHSNRMAPSRDSAIAFAQLDRVKHIASGGWWQNKAEKRFLQASTNVRNVVMELSEFACLLGFQKEDVQPADVLGIKPFKKERLNRLDRFHPIRYKDLKVFTIPALSKTIPEKTLLFQCQSIKTLNGDVAKVNSTVVFENTIPGSSIPQFHLGIGCVIEILVSEADTTDKFVMIQLFKFNEQRHATLDLPVLLLTSDYVAIKPSLRCVVNTQHDCATFKCGITGYIPIYQERQKTERSRPTVSHVEDRSFILNTFAFHNYRMLQVILPSTISRPTTYIHNRAEHDAIRASMAEKLRDKKTIAQEERELREQEVALGRGSQGRPEIIASEPIAGPWGIENVIPNKSHRILNAPPQALLPPLPALDSSHELPGSADNSETQPFNYTSTVNDQAAQESFEPPRTQIMFQFWNQNGQYDSQPATSCPVPFSVDPTHPQPQDHSAPVRFIFEPGSAFETPELHEMSTTQVTNAIKNPPLYGDSTLMSSSQQLQHQFLSNDGPSKSREKKTKANPTRAPRKKASTSSMGAQLEVPKLTRQKKKLTKDQIQENETLLWREVFDKGG